MKNRFQGRVPRMLVLLGAILLIFGLDYGVRQIYMKLTFRPLVYHHPHRIPHPVYHHGIQPLQVSVDAIGKYSAPFFSNSLGMKDAQAREVPLVGDRPRVLLMGDSFTEGIGTPWEDTFAGILAKKMEAQGIELLNGGTVSYCPHLIRLRLNELLDRGLRVARVVVFLDISDVLNELQYEAHPDGSVRYDEYAPFRDQAGKIRRINEQCGWLEAHVEKNFVLLGALVRNLRLLWRSRETKVGISDYDQIPRWAHHWPDYQGPYSRFVEEGLSRARSQMDQIERRLRGQGIALTLVVYPWPQQIRSGTRSGRGETYWRDWCTDHKVDFVSLYPVFLEDGPAEKVIQKYYWKDDCHWNEAGQIRVAETLWDRHRAALLPPPAPKASRMERGTR